LKDDIVITRQHGTGRILIFYLIGRIIMRIYGSSYKGRGEGRNAAESQKIQLVDNEQV
jgi:hypothetical protein